VRLRLRRREPFDTLSLDLESAVAEVGLPYPNPRPFADCSAVSVIWNEEARIGKLLARLQPYFSRVVVCVQKSSDRSLQIARAMAREGDVVIEDEHRGFAEGSAPIVAAAVPTLWGFILAADEWPSDDLLCGIRTITGYAERHEYDGVWVPFRSTIEGIDFEEQGGHLRIVRRRLAWPGGMHSRPKTRRSLWWPYGRVDHDRSLDEVVRDYLRYFEMGRGSPLLERHNVRMIHDSCSAVAARFGWDYVTAYEWWPQAREVAFARARQHLDPAGSEGRATRRPLLES
jgi:hypothetical protein